jgi:arylsulfatase A-like enzyme
MPQDIADSRRPNVVLVVADDMGYGDVEVLNPDSRIPTPHMNRVAAEGMSFTDAHSPSAVCTPSRYGILTGRYCWRTDLKQGVFAGYEPPLIEASRPTLATVFRGAGYRTAAMGKWHVGLGYTTRNGGPVKDSRPYPWGAPSREFEETIDFSARIRGGPTDLGFDEFFGTSACPTCQTPYGWIDGDQFIDPPSVYEDTFPFTGRPGMRTESWSHKDTDPTVLARSADFIRRNADGPFFLYVALSAPHEPCIEELVPDVARGMSSAGPRGDLVWLVDHVVGELTKALDDAGLSDDTIVIVTSDNGALPGDRVEGENGEDLYRTYGHKSNGDWRGYKAHIWEGGHREPLFVRWPGTVSAGAETDALVCLTDLMATLASIVDVNLPSDAAEDSFDISDVLFGRDPASPRKSMIHHSQKGVFAIREGDWKAVIGSQGSGGWPPPRGGPPSSDEQGQLYNLRIDPQEQDNLWEQNPHMVTRLYSVLMAAMERGRTSPGPVA